MFRNFSSLDTNIRSTTLKSQIPDREFRCLPLDKSKVFVR